MTKRIDTAYYTLQFTVARYANGKREYWNMETQVWIGLDHATLFDLFTSAEHEAFNIKEGFVATIYEKTE